MTSARHDRRRTIGMQFQNQALRLAIAMLGCLVFSQTGWSQQNLFNVPSGTITRKGEVFLQEQLNLGRFGESNTTIDYGLGNNWEVGLNIFKVNLYPVSYTHLTLPTIYSV